MINSYTVIEANRCYSHEIEIKRSRFISYAYRVQNEPQARSFLAQLKDQHRQARHICHGFVCGQARRIQRFSDDGEPSGTAGAPILEAITAHKIAKQADLSDVVVAVVRYFGGIKLGAGGLVQAYSEAAAGVLALPHYRRRQLFKEVQIPVGYLDFGRFEAAIRNLGYQMEETSYKETAAVVNALVREEELKLFRTALAELSQGQIQAEVAGSKWVDLQAI